MKTILNPSTDPTFNLALEEYLLKYKVFDDDLFYLWRNQPSIIIGRNQNPFLEVHLKQCEFYNIPIIRRISGGGTVFHDLGNINFTYITKDLKRTNDYLYFLEPIISALNHLGLNVRFEPKTHLYQGEYKLSGNAQSVHKKRLIHHGTLLFSTNQSKLTRLLKKPKNFKNSVSSTPAKTKNIQDFLFIQSSILDFMDYIKESVILDDVSHAELKLTEQDYFIINQLKKDKYETYDWNYGTNASFRTTKLVNHTRVTFHIKKGRINNISGKNNELIIFLKNTLDNTPLAYVSLSKKLDQLASVVHEPEKLIMKLAYYS